MNGALLEHLLHPDGIRGLLPLARQRGDIDTEVFLRYSNWLVNRNVIPGLEKYGITTGTVLALIVGIVGAAVIVLMYLRVTRRKAFVDFGPKRDVRPKFRRFTGAKKLKDLESGRPLRGPSFLDRLLSLHGRRTSTEVDPGWSSRGPRLWDRLPSLRVRRAPKELERIDAAPVKRRWLDILLDSRAKRDMSKPYEAKAPRVQMFRRRSKMPKDIGRAKAPPLRKPRFR